MSFQTEKFQRNPRKSLSQKKELDFFESEDKIIKRNSHLKTNNNILPEFDRNLDRSRFLSRISLPSDLRFDNNNSNKLNNLDESLYDKRSSNSKELEHSSRDKLSFRNKSQFDSFQNTIKDIKIVWKNRMPEKEKDEEKDQLDKDYENIENFLNHLNEKCKFNENIEVNYSSSTLGLTGSKKSFSKSDDKNTKINLKNIINNDKNDSKRNSPCVILCDIQHVEKKENKLDYLINTMDEYKDIIIEKMFCKNFQERIILNIYICLSQLSFKLYNCIENKTKFENLRKYVCSLTDDIKYDLINNPNFTISLINQKFIDIDSLEKGILNNYDEEIKTNDNNPINMTESKSSLNYVSKTNKNILTQSSNSNSASNKNNKENFYDFYEEEIKENFEEFNIDNGNDKDLYVNHKFLYELDTKDNANFEQNIETNKPNIVGNNLVISSQRPTKSKIRRNATHILLNKREPTTKVTNTNNNNTRYVNTNNYDFHIIDINGDTNNKETSDDSIDSDEDCIEVTENHKFERQKLIFFEDYLRDKDKRRLTKIDSIEIKADQKFLDDKERLSLLNEISYKNIITIVNDNPSLLPSHQLNLNPIDLAQFIKDKECLLGSDNDLESGDEKEEENGNLEKSSSNSGEGSSENNEFKDIIRFGDINDNKMENNEDNKLDNLNQNIDNISNFSQKSLSNKSGKKSSDNKILKFNFEENEDDDN